MKNMITLLAGFIVCIFVNSADAVNFIEVKNDDQLSQIDYRIPHGMSLNSDVVIFTKNGKPLLPDLEKPNKTDTANNLTFTFNSPDYPWTDVELVTLQQLIADSYPVIKKIYGNPAFLITVNIQKDPSITVGGYYNPSLNLIVVHDLNRYGAVIHEIIHAFHDDLCIGNTAYEEGMTRAVEIAVFNELPQWDSDGDAFHAYGIDVYYDLQNEPSLSSRNGSFFNGFPNPLMKYQQAGYAWGKLLIEDNEFLTKFNRNYYSYGYIDPLISGNTLKIKGIAEEIKHTVEGVPFSSWYDRQYILNENFNTGYQTVFKGDTNTLYFFNRDLNGLEQSLQGEIVYWSVYSCDGTNLLSGADVTSELGWINIPLYLIQYKGKVKIEANILSDGIDIKRQIFTSTAPRGAGLFGVADTCTGVIDVVKVKPGVKTSVKNVIIENGAFSIPGFTSIPGTFTIKQIDGAERTITKDASDYFVNFGANSLQ